jgi:hypothetical protein
MKKILGSVGIFFLLLAYYMFVPERICSVEWADIDMNPIDGPFHTCPATIDKRRIGILEFARVDGGVYRVAGIRGNGRLPRRGLRPQVTEQFLLIKLDSPLNWDKLQEYYGGRYLSDGNVVFNMGGERMPALTPPLDVAQLRPVPGSKGMGVYATDGYWVLNYDKVVVGADAATFQEVKALESDGTTTSVDASMNFGRDRNRVYRVEKKIDGADPDSFGLISYHLGDPPPGINFRSDSVSRGSGWVAVDKKQAWEVDFTGTWPLPVTDIQLKTLKRDLLRAIAAAQSDP